MKIISPTLDREELATKENIQDIIRLIEGKNDPFAILQKNELTFMQVLWTHDGYILEYQENSILNHYRVKELISQEDAIWSLQSYLKGEVYWKAKFDFEKIEIADPFFKIGHKIGYIVGKISNFITGR